MPQLYLALAWHTLGQEANGREAHPGRLAQQLEGPPARHQAAQRKDRFPRAASLSTPW